MTVDAQNDAGMPRASRDRDDDVEGQEEIDGNEGSRDHEGQRNYDGSINTRVVGAASSFLDAHIKQQIEAYKLKRVELLERPGEGHEASEGKAQLSPEDSTLLACELLRIARQGLPMTTEQFEAVHRELPQDLRDALEEKREQVKRALGAMNLPRPWTIQDLVDEQERVREEATRRRIAELESKGTPDALSIRERIELRLLRLRHQQRELRGNVLRFMKRARTADFAFDHSYRRKKKQSMREIRALEKLEARQRHEQGRQVQQAYNNYLQSVLNQVREIQSHSRAIQQRNARIAKAVMQYHATVEREEQKRLERVSRERLRALKADDEEAYMRLIDQQKDTRLTHLLRQTDEFLEGLTTKMLAQQNEDTDGMPVTTASTDYYTTAHRVKEEVYEQPVHLVGGKLKEYQVKGLQWMLSLYNNHLNGILADEMGLGKTIQTISLVTYLMERKGQNGPFLIVVPLSTMTNWSIEFEKWAPHVTKVEYRGQPPQRKAAAQIIKSGKFNVVLTTYEYVIKDKSVLSKPRWLYMIIDEGHRMKNTHSKLAITLSSVYSSRYRVILTGTPLQNNLPELWALLNFILPRIFNSGKTFEEWFNTPFANTGEKIELNEEETLLIIRRLHKVLRPFLLRRLKKDVEAELPDKIERIIKCPMSALQQRLYAAVTQRNLTSSAPGMIRRFNNIVMQLRKICNHPFVFEEVERQVNPYKTNNDLLYRVSGKFELLARILPKFQVTNHRILMFFQMTQIMTIMEDFLTMLGMKYLRLDGSTKSEERSELLAKFNAPNSPYFVFLLSTRAGGLGLNLQTADTVVIFDSDWNPHQDLQAQDRAHRIGQTKEVRIFRLITSNSIEEYILERAQFKLNLDGKVIQAGKFDQKSTNEEREALLRALIEGEAHEERGESEDDDYKEDDEINELIARGDPELQLFRDIDAKGKRRRLIEAHELPTIFLENLEEEQRQQQLRGLQREDSTPSVRSSRLKQVAYDETISDDAWLRRLEKETRQTKSTTPSLKLRLSVPSTSTTTTTTSTRKRVSGGITSGFPPDPRIQPHHYAHVLSVIESMTDKQSGRYRAELFAELPSPADYPDYYDLIASPISLAEIHSKAYSSLEELLADISLMASNAMTYNLEGSLVYEDAMQIRLVGERTIAGIKRKLDTNEDVSAVEEDGDSSGEVEGGMDEDMSNKYEEEDEFMDEDEVSDE